MKLKRIAILVLMIQMIMLISCAKNSSMSNTSLTIYQPTIIRLKANSEVQTVDGLYKPQVDEVWHSDKRFRELERSLYYPSYK
jgi:hypothetical protein